MLMIEESAKISRLEMSFLPTPNRTDSWKPVRHASVVETMIEKASRHGLTVKNETYACLNGKLDGVVIKGANLFGTIDFHTPTGIDFPAGCGPSAGIRNSNDKSFALSILSGARVFICSNGVLRAEHIVSRKHTAHLNMREQIDEALGQFMESISGFNKGYERMVNRRLTHDQARSTIVELSMQGAFGPQMIVPIVKEFENPRHAEFKEPNAWNLYQAATEIMKAQSPTRQYEGLKALTTGMNALALLN